MKVTHLVYTGPDDLTPEQMSQLVDMWQHLQSNGGEHEVFLSKHCLEVREIEVESDSPVLASNGLASFMSPAEAIKHLENEHDDLLFYPGTEDEGGYLIVVYRRYSTEPRVRLDGDYSLQDLKAMVSILSTNIRTHGVVDE